MLRQGIINVDAIDIYPEVQEHKILSGIYHTEAEDKIPLKTSSHLLCAVLLTTQFLVYTAVST